MELSDGNASGIGGTGVPACEMARRHGGLHHYLTFFWQQGAKFQPI